MTHPEYISNSDVFPTLTHANYCVVVFVALMLKTQSDLDFFKIFKFCKKPQTRAILSIPDSEAYWQTLIELRERSKLRVKFFFHRHGIITYIFQAR